MSDYRNLKVWHRTLDFISHDYDITSHFPNHELYGLTSQIRRATTSIALNIAKGATSGYNNEFSRFLRVAIRSANEVSAGFEVAKRLGYCESNLAQKQIQEADEIAFMLQGLLRSLKRTAEEQAIYATEITKLDTQFFDDEFLTTSN